MPAGLSKSVFFGVFNKGILNFKIKTVNKFHQTDFRSSSEVRAEPFSKGSVLSEGEKEQIFFRHGREKKILCSVWGKLVGGF